MKLDKDSYENEDFSNLLIEDVELSRKKFVKCKFCATDFSEVSVFFRCTFDTCNFTDAKLNGVEIKNSAFLSCKFKHAAFFSTMFEDCKMTGSDFLDAECALMGIDGGDWSYTVLRHQDFSKQNFSGIRFFGADLEGSRFTQCDLKSCDFSEAMVHETSFFGSDLRDATFGNLDFTEVNLKKAKIDLQQCVTIAEVLTEAQYLPADSSK